MSLFDSIRYPISYPPTVEELDRIPEALLMKWAVRVRWREEHDDTPFYKGVGIQVISRWYNSDNHSITMHEDITILRQMISEYEDDNI